MKTERGAEDHVLIIGGGIAGIAAALKLLSHKPSCRVTIAESTPRLGGKIAGEIFDGCVIDGGADVCIGAKLRATDAFQALGLEQHVIRVNPRMLPTFEQRDGRLARLPTSFGGELLTFRGGMQELVAIAAASLAGVRILLNVEITALSHRHGRWLATDSASTVHVADAAIIAAPAHAASTLLRSIPVENSEALNALAYPATTTVSAAWRESDVPGPLEGTGYLVADGEKALTACTWTSSKNPSHAAPGVVLLRGYLRGTGFDAVSLLREEVASTLGITAPPLFTRVYEWSAGIPAYTSGHEATVRAITERLTDVPGVFVAGSSFHGVGIPDCIHSGERAALTAVRYLEQRQTGEAA